jgi:S-formylglutathione hydrolase FrmB
MAPELTLGPPWSYPLRGRLDEHVIDSQALTGNPLGDPHRRPLLVQLPPGYDADATLGYPTIYLLQGLSGHVDQWQSRKADQPNVPERLDEMFAAGTPPAIIVYVDAWTRLRGSQFIDSPGTGRYHTYLADEVVAFVDAAYRTRTDPGGRALAGHSSGGYGAIVNAMLRPDLFGAVADHAGDGLFEACYGADLWEAARMLRDRYGADYDRFWADLAARPGQSRPGDGALINAYCMAACYSSDADGTVRLPFDPRTGAPLPEVWQRWLDHDPIRMASRHADALRSLRGIWIDAGRSDEYFLDLAASALRDQLSRLGVAADTIHYELYDGTHSNMEWRYPLSFAWLIEQMSRVSG